MTEMKTSISFSEMQEMNDYLAMENDIEAAVGKALMPKVDK